VATEDLDLTSAEWVAEAPSSCRRSACEPVPLANFGTHGFSRITAVGDDHAGTLVDPAWTTVPIQLVPSSRGGFFPGPERGARAPRSTAGTSRPTEPSTDGRTFSLSWLAKAP
jgi:Peptidase A4 family